MGKCGITNFTDRIGKMFMIAALKNAKEQIARNNHIFCCFFVF